MGRGVGDQEHQLQRRRRIAPRRRIDRLGERLVERLRVVAAAVGDDLGERGAEGLHVGREVEGAGDEGVALVAVDRHREAHVRAALEGGDAGGDGVDARLEPIDLVAHRAGGVEQEQDVERNWSPSTAPVCVDRQVGGAAGGRR